MPMPEDPHPTFKSGDKFYEDERRRLNRQRLIWWPIILAYGLFIIWAHFFAP